MVSSYAEFFPTTEVVPMKTVHYEQCGLIRVATTLITLSDFKLDFSVLQLQRHLPLWVSEKKNLFEPQTCFLRPIKS